MFLFIFFSALMIVANAASNGSEKPNKNETAILKLDFVNHENVVHGVTVTLSRLTNSKIDYVLAPDGKPAVSQIKVKEDAIDEYIRQHPYAILPRNLTFTMLITMSRAKCTDKSCRFATIEDIVDFLNSPEALKEFKVGKLEAVVIDTDRRHIWVIIGVIFGALIVIVTLPAICGHLGGYLKLKRKQWKVTEPKKVEIEMQPVQVTQGTPMLKPLRSSIEEEV